MFLSLQVMDKSSPSPINYSIPVTWGEIEVIKSIISYSLPRLLAFDCIWDQNNMDGSSFLNSPSPPNPPEWR